MKIFKFVAFVFLLMSISNPLKAQVEIRLAAAPTKINVLDDGSSTGFVGEFAYQIPGKRYSIYGRISSTWIKFNYVDPEVPLTEGVANVSALQNVFGMRFDLIKPNTEKSLQQKLYLGANIGSINYSSQAELFKFVVDGNGWPLTNIPGNEVFFRTGIEAGYRIGTESIGLDLNLGFVQPFTRIRGHNLVEMAIGVYFVL